MLRIDRTGRGLLLALPLAAALAGCSASAFRRSDRAAPWSGDDLAANTAIQTVSPWPRASFDRRAPALGVKVENAMKNYKKPTAPPPTKTNVVSGALSGSGS